MFSKKGYQEYYRKLPLWINKTLDSKREFSQRVVYFKKLIDNMENVELQEFINKHADSIFLIFYEEFMNLFSSLKSRGGIRACADQFRFLCQILKNVLICVPKKVKCGWNFRAIHFVIRKLVHPLNYPKIKCYGLELYLIWVQVLQNPNDKFVSNIMLTMLLEFYPSLSGGCFSQSKTSLKDASGAFDLSNKTASSNESAKDEVSLYWEEASPYAVIPSSEKVGGGETALNTFILRSLNGLTLNLNRICWREPHMMAKSFETSFEMFRSVVLENVFPHIQTAARLFFGSHDDFDMFKPQPGDDFGSDLEMVMVRQNVVQWLMGFIKKSSERSNPASSLNISENLFKSGSSTQQAQEKHDGHHETNENPASTPDNHSLLGINSTIALKRVNCKAKEVATVVSNALFKTIENVSCIFEIFRVTLLSSDDNCHDFTREILYEFYHWCKGINRPCFVYSEDPATALYKLETCQPPLMGVQKFHRILLYLSLYPFYSFKGDSDKFLKNCTNLKRSLRYVRIFVTECYSIIDAESWVKITYPLVDVVKIVSGIAVLHRGIAAGKIDKISAISSFLSYFYQTVFIEWLRANMRVMIPVSLWDQFTTILQNSPYSREMFQEWTDCLEIATRSYCYNIFGIDIYNLPLDRELTNLRKLRKTLQSKPKTTTVNKVRDNTSFTKINLNDSIKTFNACQHYPYTFSKTRAEESAAFPSDTLIRNAKTSSVGALSSDILMQSRPTLLKLHDLEPSSGNTNRTNPTGSQGHVGADYCSEYMYCETDCGPLAQGEEALAEEDLNRRSSTSLPCHHEFKEQSTLDGDSPAHKVMGQSVSDHELIGYDENKAETQDFASFQDESFKSIGSHNPAQRYDMLNRDEMMDNQIFDDVACDNFSSKDHTRVLWRRLVLLFGPISKLANLDSQVAYFKALLFVFEKLEDVSKNIGISEDKKYMVPNESMEQPNLHYFVPLAIDFIYTNSSQHLIVLEAEKLLLRSFLSPYNMGSISESYWIILFDTIKKLLLMRNKEINEVFFRYAIDLFSGNAPNLFSLSGYVLDAAAFLMDEMLESSYHVANFFKAIAPYMVEFTCCEQDSEIEPHCCRFGHYETEYIRLCVIAVTRCRTWASRCCYLAALFQILLTKIVNKEDPPLIKLLLTVLAKHMYSSDINVLVMTSNFLSTLTCYLHSLSELIPGAETKLFLYCSSALVHATATVKGRKAGVCRMYNGIMCGLDMLGEFIFRLPDVSTDVLVNFYDSLNSHLVERELQDRRFEDTPFLYSLEEVGPIEETSSLSSCYSSFSDVQVVSGTQSMEDLNNDTPSDPVDGAETEAHINDKRNSFLAKVRHMNEFCMLILGNFPLPSGPECISSRVSESDMFACDDDKALPECVVLCLDDNTLVTVCEYGQRLSYPFECPMPSISQNATDSEEKTVLVVRSPLGKFCWVFNEMFFNHKASAFKQNRKEGGLSIGRVTPKTEENKDELHDLVLRVTNSYPEMTRNYDFMKRNAVPSDNFAQSIYVNRLLKGHLSSIEEANFFQAVVPSPPVKKLKQYRLTYRLSLLLFSQLGYFYTDHRQRVSLLRPCSRLFRDLRQSDNRFVRSSHKLAVFYIKFGQEDKDQILQNDHSSASSQFNDFISGMGWRVELETHMGFMGGLEKSYIKGCNTVYYCTPLNEVIFHVATLLPLEEGVNGIINKMRHLGNDEVHIVWSEHFRPFRKGIINTEFADVIIVIYPLTNGLFKISIIKKPNIPPFGPLLDGSIIPLKFVATLVRETAINASHNIRMNHHLYKTSYEDRLNVIRQIKEKYSAKMSFEEFLDSFLCKAYKVPSSDNR